MFPKLFRTDNDETTEITLNELEERANDEQQPDGDGDDREQPESVGGFTKHWGWIAVTNELANNDMTKWDYFDELPVIEFLNLTCFLIDKRNHENEKRGEK